MLSQFMCALLPINWKSQSSFLWMGGVGELSITASARSTPIPSSTLCSNWTSFLKVFLLQLVRSIVSKTVLTVSFSYNQQLISNSPLHITKDTRCFSIRSISQQKRKQTTNRNNSPS